jgi:hypothetical protein
MLKSSKDPLIALMSYRATPLPWCDLSPAELSMGRRIRTTIPQTNKQLVPQWNFLEAFYEKNKQFKESQKVHFDRRHRAREPSPIPDDAEVWITSEGQPIQGRVLSQADTPRSYVVDTPTGTLAHTSTMLAQGPMIGQLQWCWWRKGWLV